MWSQIGRRYNLLGFLTRNNPHKPHTGGSSSSGFEIFNFYFMVTLFYVYILFIIFRSVESPIIDNELIIDPQSDSIVTSRNEPVLSTFWCFNLPPPSDGNIIGEVFYNSSSTPIKINLFVYSSFDKIIKVLSRIVLA